TNLVRQMSPECDAKKTRNSPGTFASRRHSIQLHWSKTFWSRSRVMKAKLAAIAVVAALIPLGAAMAQTYGGSKDSDKSRSSADCKKLDTNKDGKISQSEAAADSSIVFSSADTNGDGYIDSSEWKAASKGSKPQSQSQPSDQQTQPRTPADSTGMPQDGSTP